MRFAIVFIIGLAACAAHPAFAQTVKIKASAASGAPVTYLSPYEPGMTAADALFSPDVEPELSDGPNWQIAAYYQISEFNGSKFAGFSILSIMNYPKSGEYSYSPNTTNYYVFCVNNVVSQSGVSDTPLQLGDVISFNYQSASVAAMCLPD